jgi:hypothetical protein
VEVASGLGLIRNAVTTANDALASFSQEVALLGASAMMTPQERERLDGLLAAVDARGRSREMAPLPGGAAEGSVVEVATGNGPFALSGHDLHIPHGWPSPS